MLFGGLAVGDNASISGAIGGKSKARLENKMRAEKAEMEKRE